jgi:ubiquinone/menaquinone biosynthesis C-methylase UbiE
MKDNINTCDYWNYRYSNGGINTACPEVWKHTISFFKYDGFESYVGSEKVLDIGCGCGLGLRLINLLYPYKNLYGVDISSTAIDRVGKLIPSAKLLVSKVPPLIFENDSFDTIIATEILEHVDNAEDLIKEIVRVLKPTGRLLMTFPNNCLGEVPEHMTQFTVKQMIDLLLKYELYPISVDYFKINANASYCFIAANFEGLK